MSTEEKMSLKKFVKVWSQAGATFVAALVAFAVMRGWLDWDSDTCMQFTVVYGAFMLVLRQMFSVTEDAGATIYGGSINVETDDEGKKLFTLELDGDPNDIDKSKSITFKVNPS